jgi:membrane-associated phospholipid phosphatase
MQGILQWITGLGDAALLVPLSLLLLAFFVYRRSKSGAADWAIALAICVIATVVGKVCFRACEPVVSFLGVRSPSGHVSFGATYYLSIAAAASLERPAWHRYLILAASSLVVLAIAASRVMLHAHTLTEVVLGGAIGVASAGWFIYRFRHKQQVMPDWRVVTGTILALVLLTHGWHLDVDATLVKIARIIGSHLPACVAIG